MKPIFRCPICGNDSNVGQEFCTHCRHKFDYICRGCSKPISYNEEICPHCSQSVGKKISRQYEDTKAQKPWWYSFAGVICILFGVSAVVSLLLGILSDKVGGIATFVVQGVIALGIYFFGIRKRRN